MTNRFSVVVFAVAMTACLTPAAPRRAKVATNVAIGFVHQSQTQGWSGTVPDQFAKIQTSALEKRNLVAIPVALSTDATGAELTRARLATMAASKRAGVVILLETASRYDSQIVGRYRWTVFAKITVADAADLERSTSRTIDVPITLEYDHLRDDAALNEAAKPIARELGVVVDSYMASYGTTRAPSKAAGLSPQTPDYDAIYFVMVDRFANGDRGNDGSDTDTSDPAAWHGGDIDGLIDRLDYIAELGAKTLWLTPIMKTRAAKFHGHGAFHGYWTEDHSKLEPRFGNEEDLARLGREASARGIAIYLDMVLNHVGPEAPLASEKPEWFHRHGQIKDWNDPVELQSYQVHGLPDLDQSNAEVYEYLLNASTKWAATPGIKGFRLDAVRHIAPSFWRRFLADIRRGRADFTLLGEVFDGNPAAIADGFELGFDQLFDFPLHYTALDALCGRAPYRELAAALGADRAYPDPTQLITFADNHDTPRAASKCSDRNLERLYFFLLSVRGIPAITWGTEIGLSGAGEPENRADMRFGPETRLGRWIRERLSARRQHPSLRGVVRELRTVDDDAVIWAQQAGGETAVIGLSRSKRPRQLTVDGAARLESGFTRCGSQCLELPAGAMGVAFIDAPPLAGGQRKVQLRATGAPAGELLLVGNVPELGVWRAEQAAKSVANTFNLELPVGEALAFKLATKSGEKLTFESGRNRTLVVARGEGPVREELRWRR